MYGVLGENISDAATLKELVKRISSDDRLAVKTKGYEGCSELLRKGANQLRLMAELGCRRFIICYDADQDDPAVRRETVDRVIVGKSGIALPCCIVVPVQELEAWILADIQAVTQLFKWWNPNPILNPESIANPKEHLEKLSRDQKHKPRYSHATHNERIAKHLDLQKLREVCPSFRPLYQFVLANE